MIGNFKCLSPCIHRVRQMGTGSLPDVPARLEVVGRGKVPVPICRTNTMWPETGTGTVPSCIVRALFGSAARSQSPFPRLFMNKNCDTHLFHPSRRGHDSRQRGITNQTPCFSASRWMSPFRRLETTTRYRSSIRSCGPRTADGTKV